MNDSIWVDFSINEISSEIEMNHLESKNNGYTLQLEKKQNNGNSLETVAIEYLGEE